LRVQAEVLAGGETETEEGAVVDVVDFFAVERTRWKTEEEGEWAGKPMERWGGKGQFASLDLSGHFEVDPVLLDAGERPCWSQSESKSTYRYAINLFNSASAFSISGTVREQ
jgi:hypothetical protein